MPCTGGSVLSIIRLLPLKSSRSGEKVFTRTLTLIQEKVYGKVQWEIRGEREGLISLFSEGNEDKVECIGRVEMRIKENVIGER